VVAVAQKDIKTNTEARTVKQRYMTTHNLVF